MTESGPAAPQPGVSIGLLGPVTLSVDGVAVHPGGPRQRAALAVLAASSESISADALADAVWSHQEAAGSRATLQVHVHNIRKSFGDHGGVLQSGPAGYRLVGAAVDVIEARSMLNRARIAWNSGDAGATASLYRRALALFRGEFCTDLVDLPSLEAHRAQWSRERREAVDALMDAELRLGTAGLASELEAELERDPLHERLWGQLMVALYREGRQVAALDAYQRARQVLADEVGLDPSAPLRALEAAVLEQAGTTQLLAIAGRTPGGGSSVELLWLDSAGRQRRRAVPVGATLTVGRDPDADIALEHDGAASRWHSVIAADGAEVLISDTGSTNGTWVNGARLEPHERASLRRGDLVRCGGTMIFVNDSRSNLRAGHEDRTLLV